MRRTSDATCRCVCIRNISCIRANLFFCFFSFVFFTNNSVNDRTLMVIGDSTAEFLTRLFVDRIRGNANTRNCNLSPISSTRLHIFFLQKGLVLGVYETESESNVVFTPTAAKYNELVNGKLLQNILL